VPPEVFVPRGAPAGDGAPRTTAAYDRVCAAGAGVAGRDEAAAIAAYPRFLEARAGAGAGVVIGKPSREAAGNGAPRTTAAYDRFFAAGAGTLLGD
jgi:hypothetical protein